MEGQKSVFSSRALVAVLLFSMIFSACAGETAISNSTARNDAGTTSPEYRTEAMNSNSTSNMSVAKATPDYYDGEGNMSGERYAEISENPFLEASRAPLSTFSIDVDTASYANVRRYLNHGQLPPKDAVRIEELINYFEYDYPQPIGDQPFSVNTEVADLPVERET